jgi:hypothetical protein
MGGVAERGRVMPAMVFSFLWATLVYCPVACWGWNVNGWGFKWGVLDYAGECCCLSIFRAFVKIRHRRRRPCRNRVWCGRPGILLGPWTSWAITAIELPPSQRIAGCFGDVHALVWMAWLQRRFCLWRKLACRYGGVEYQHYRSFRECVYAHILFYHC